MICSPVAGTRTAVTVQYSTVQYSDSRDVLAGGWDEDGGDGTVQYSTVQ